MDMSMMMNELEGRTPAAMEIIYHFLSMTLPTLNSDVKILPQAVPLPGEVHSDIVIRAMGDNEALQTVNTNQEELQRLLSQMATHFNHLKYAEGLERIGKLARQIHKYSQELAVAKQRCLEELELYAGELLHRGPDNRQSLVLNAGSIPWEIFRQNAKTDMQNFCEEYSRISREVGEKLTMAAKQFTGLAVDMEQIEEREQMERDWSDRNMPLDFSP